MYGYILFLVFHWLVIYMQLISAINQVTAICLFGRYAEIVWVSDLCPHRWGLFLKVKKRIVLH